MAPGLGHRRGETCGHVHPDASSPESLLDLRLLETCFRARGVARPAGLRCTWGSTPGRAPVPLPGAGQPIHHVWRLLGRAPTGDAVRNWESVTACSTGVLAVPLHQAVPGGGGVPQAQPWSEGDPTLCSFGPLEPGFATNNLRAGGTLARVFEVESPPRAVLHGWVEKERRDCLLGDEAWQPVCDPGWALAGGSGAPHGLLPLRHRQDPRQHILLPHPPVGGGRGRFLPTPQPCSLKVNGVLGTGEGV